MRSKRDASERLLSARQRSLFALGAVMGCVVVARTVYLQTARRDAYSALGDAMRARERVIAPRRGDILDRTGHPLARTSDVARVEFDPTKSTAAELPERAAFLAECLGMAAADVTARIEAPPRPGIETARNKIIKDPATPEEAQLIRRLSVSRGSRRKLQGTVVKVAAIRSYPGGGASVQVVGLLRPTAFGLTQGTSGIERWADLPLSGGVGWLSAHVDPRGRPIATVPQSSVPVVDGLNVHTTLDPDVQRICATALDDCIKEHTPAGATVVVLDPATGDVLGMVSAPTIDPADRDKLRGADERLRNRALEYFEPGSTMKPITVSVALDTGALAPDKVLVCSGDMTIAGKRIRCEAHRSSGPPPGYNTARGVVVKSCNVGAARIALSLGGKRLEEGLGRFGLLSPAGIQLIGDRAGSFGFGQPHLDPRDAYVARVGFGQSVLVTPLGMASAYAAIANGGLLVKPRLVTRFADATGKTVREFGRQPAARAISPEVAEAMRGFLEAVVDEGTGRPNAVVPGYSAAGKTGTAQKAIGPVYREYMASFMGFVPARSPRAVIVVVVDEPRNGYHGSQAAAPTWSRIAEKLMWHWHVAPDRPETARARVRAAGGPGRSTD